MRLITLLFLAVSTFGVAQDTNFPTGPQYLMNNGSPLLLHSIETPSLSLSTPLATAPGASPEQGSGEPRTPAFGELQTQAAIDRIYWGVPTIAAENATPERSGGVVFISSRAASNLPSSVFDTGVTSIADADSVRGRSVPLGDIARALKANRRPASHVFTNDNIGHLRSQ
jgi:hypothetical protein